LVQTGMKPRTRRAATRGQRKIESANVKESRMLAKRKGQGCRDGRENGDHKKESSQRTHALAATEWMKKAAQVT
jgi:hypothetical protein